MDVKTEEKKFRDEPMASFYRHWECPKEGCGGEMVSTGHGFTTMSTSWQHRCNKCGHEDLAGKNYPSVVHITQS